MINSSICVKRDRWFFRIDENQPHRALRIHSNDEINEKCVDYNPQEETHWPVTHLFKLYETEIIKIVKHFVLDISVDPKKEPFFYWNVFNEYVHQHRLAKSLSLQNRGIIVLPPHIDLFEKIKILNLSNNNIKLLPELSNETLEELDISGNEGIDLSVSNLKHLRNLRILKANHCDWAEIPEILEECPSLERLELSGNRITFIPDWISRISVDFGKFIEPAYS